MRWDDHATVAVSLIDAREIAMVSLQEHEAIPHEEYARSVTALHHWDSPPRAISRSPLSLHLLLQAAFRAALHSSRLTAESAQWLRS